jgi:hypothetical protein
MLRVSGSPQREAALFRQEPGRRDREKGRGVRVMSMRKTKLRVRRKKLQARPKTSFRKQEARVFERKHELKEKEAVK